MTNQFELVGNKLTDGWLTMVFTPAFRFWAAGAGLVLYESKSWAAAGAWLTGLPVLHQVLLVVAGLILVAGSNAVVERCVQPAIRTLEGYGLPWWSWLRDLATAWRGRRIERLEQRFFALDKMTKRSEAEARERVRLDNELRWVPVESDDRMPTELGDILRTGEVRPTMKYGLDGVLVWPRLWLQMPNDARGVTEAARDDLHADTTVFLWGALFLGWTPWSPWALLVGAIVIVYAYRAMVGSAKVFAEAVDTAYDLYRWRVYESVGWPLPSNPKEELVRGSELNRYLLRGSQSEEPLFVRSGAS